MTKDHIITIFAEDNNSELSLRIKEIEKLLSKDKNLISALKLFGYSFSDLSLEMEKVSKMDPDVIFSKVKKYFEDVQKEAANSKVTTYEEGLSAAASSLLKFNVSQITKFSSEEESEEDGDSTTELNYSESEDDEEESFDSESEEDDLSSASDIEEMLNNKKEEQERIESSLSILQDKINILKANLKVILDLGDQPEIKARGDEYSEMLNNKKELEERRNNIKLEIEQLTSKLKKSKRNESFRNVYNMFGSGFGKAKEVGSGVLEKGSDTVDRINEFKDSEAGKVTIGFARNGISGVIAAILSPIGVLPGLFYDFDAKKKGKLTGLKNPISLTNLAVCCFLAAFSGMTFYYVEQSLPDHLALIASYIALIASSNLLSSGARAVSKGVYNFGKSKEITDGGSSNKGVTITGKESKEELRALYKKNKNKLTQEQKEAILNRIFED